MIWFAFAASLAAAFSPEADDQATPAGWTRQQVAVGAYSIAVPPRVRGGGGPGIDSLMAQYRGAGFRIDLDFGMYGGPPDCRANHCSTIEIDGLPATLARGEQPSSTGGNMAHWLHLYIALPDAAGSRDLGLVASAHCATAVSCDAAVRMLETIDFNLEPRRRR